MKHLALRTGITPLSRQQIAARAARDVPDGSFVNLGIGMPTLIADHMTAGKEVIYHSENGMLGMGPAPAPGEEDENLVNAGKQFVTLVRGGCYFDSAQSFMMMRGGHLDMVFLGAFQVSETGDLANWVTDDRNTLPSVGGAMDLAVGCRDIRVLMEQVTRDGKPRVLRRCTYPLTAKRAVKRIYTDLAVIDVTESGLVVREMVEGLDFDRLQELTEAPLCLHGNWSLLA
nr:3-oxoacid CoA-transferase subunit B [Geobacter sp.]